MLAALWPLTAGHLLAMLLVILPFAVLVTLVEWQHQIQIGASLLVGHWLGYDRRNWGFGLSPWRSRMVPD